MKIAVAVNAFPQISETFIRNHIISLLELGHHVTILADSILSEGSELPDVKAYDLISRVVLYEKPNYSKSRIQRIFYKLSKLKYILRYPVQTLRLLNFFRFGMDALRGRVLLAGYQLLPNQKFDIIHCHFGPVGFRISQLIEAKLLAGKLIVSFHGYDLTSSLLKTYRIKYVFEKADILVVNSEFLQDKLNKLGAPGKTMICPVGLLLENFQPITSKGSTREVIEVLSVGRLVQVKGYPIMLKAFSKVLEGAQINLKYTIIGDGPMRKELHHMVKSLGLEDHVVFKGNQSSDLVYEAMACADIFMLCGIEDENGQVETQGLVYQEAHAMGLPVLGSMLGGAIESITDGRDGLLCEPGNVESVTKNLLKLINNQSLRDEMGQNGRRKVYERYNQLTITDKILRELDNIK